MSVTHDTPAPDAQTTPAAKPAKAVRVETPFQRFVSEFFESPLATVGLIMLVSIVTLALLAPFITPQNPYDLGQVDVLDARRNLVQAQTNYSRSRYDYVLNVMRLRLAAGTLDRDTLAEINGWLVERAP